MLRVLIVDDDQAILRAMADYLGAVGYSVETATSCDVAAQHLANGCYDVVMAALHLSHRDATDGLEILAAAKARFPAVRTVLLSASMTPDAEAAAARIGVDRCLQKPTHLARLASVLAGLLDPQGTGRGGIPPGTESGE